MLRRPWPCPNAVRIRPCPPRAPSAILITALTTRVGALSGGPADDRVPAAGTRRGMARRATIDHRGQEAAGTARSTAARARAGGVGRDADRQGVGRLPSRQREDPRPDVRVGTKPRPRRCDRDQAGRVSDPGGVRRDGPGPLRGAGRPGAQRPRTADTQRPPRCSPKASTCGVGRRWEGSAGPSPSLPPTWTRNACP